MSRGFRAEETINRPVDQVWSYLTDPSHVTDWMDGVDRFRFPDGNHVGPGSTYEFEARGVKRDGLVTIWEPQARMALSSTQGGVTAIYTYELQKSGDSTQVSLHAECEAKGTWRLLHPLIGFMMKRADQGQLSNLKRAIES